MDILKARVWRGHIGSWKLEPLLHWPYAFLVCLYLQSLPVALRGPGETCPEASQETLVLPESAAPRSPKVPQAMQPVPSLELL